MTMQVCSSTYTQRGHRKRSLSLTWTSFFVLVLKHKQLMNCKNNQQSWNCFLIRAALQYKIIAHRYNSLSTCNIVAYYLGKVTLNRTHIILVESIIPKYGRLTYSQWKVIQVFCSVSTSLFMPGHYASSLMTHRPLLSTQMWLTFLDSKKDSSRQTNYMPN